jgi:hypothetical protein
MAALTGEWSGQAIIIVNWCHQRQLALAITVAADGTVTGRVGDAQLLEGRLRLNRGALGRMLNIKTDYRITGKLKGPIVAAEGIARDSVSIPFNLAAGAIRGGVHTSGSLFGGEKSMIFSAARMVLTRKASPEEGSKSRPQPGG